MTLKKLKVINLFLAAILLSISAVKADRKEVGSCPTVEEIKNALRNAKKGEKSVSIKVEDVIFPMTVDSDVSTWKFFDTRLLKKTGFPLVIICSYTKANNFDAVGELSPKANKIYSNRTCSFDPKDKTIIECTKEKAGGCVLYCDEREK